MTDRELLELLFQKATDIEASITEIKTDISDLGGRINQFEQLLKDKNSISLDKKELAQDHPSRVDKNTSFSFEELKIIKPGEESKYLNYPQIIGLLRNNAEQSQRAFIKGIVIDKEKMAGISTSNDFIEAIKPGEAMRFKIGFADLDHKQLPHKWEIRVTVDNKLA